MTGSTPESETLTKLTYAVHPSFAMLAGMQLDLFTPLKGGPMNAAKEAEPTNREAGKVWIERKG
jgi:hypothetical protein